MRQFGDGGGGEDPLVCWVMCVTADVAMFEREYGTDIERARREWILEVKRAVANFHWLYREARKTIEDER